jgi:hypothetical protein
MRLKSKEWWPSPENVPKINFDVAIRDSFSLGVAIFHDSSEKFLFAWTEKLPWGAICG